MSVSMQDAGLRSGRNQDNEAMLGEILSLPVIEDPMPDAPDELKVKQHDRPF